MKKLILLAVLSPAALACQDYGDITGPLTKKFGEQIIFSGSSDTVPALYEFWAGANSWSLVKRHYIDINGVRECAEMVSSGRYYQRRDYQDKALPPTPGAVNLQCLDRAIYAKTLAEQADEWPRISAMAAQSMIDIYVGADSWTISSTAAATNGPYAMFRNEQGIPALRFCSWPLASGVVSHFYEREIGPWF